MSKVVVITGASKGIGAATAIAFAKSGYDVVVNYQNDTEAATKIAGEVEACDQKSLLVQADVFTESGIKLLFKMVKETFQKIDVLINNTADTTETGFGGYSFDEVNKYMSANFGATVFCCQEALQLMDSGSILFTASVYGLQFGGSPSLILYSAAKATMINFSQALAEKLAPQIRCNVVVPGSTRTPHWKDTNSDYAKTSLSMTLQNEWVEPEEIANTFVFLAETPHINAQTIVVDAGWQKKIRPSGPPHN